MIQLELASLKRDWLDDVQPQVVLMLPRLGEFTSDDLHALGFPAPANVNWWGVLLAQLRNRGLIVRVGARPSARPEANGRLVSVWRAA